MRRFFRIFLLLIVVAAAGLFALNTNLGLHRTPGKPLLFAHRGFTQTYPSEGVGRDTCTATRIHPPRHDFMENTLPSMLASVQAGADVIELDVHPTSDGTFVVFHDWTLDCRTNGKGVTREQPLAYLKTLDVGHGYTADGGKTFPLRGKGVGLMPTLDEVLAALPRQRLLINVKSRDPEEGRQLAAVLRELPPARRAMIMAYGGAEPIAQLRELLPDVRTFSRASVIACMKGYLATGWFGALPEACHGTVMLVPINVAPWLWGWPWRFMARFDAVGTQVVLLGPWRGGSYTTGIDTPQDFARVPEGFDGGIWTNEISSIGRLARERR